MPQMGLQQARVIDPILTRYVQIGPSQGEMIGKMLFPSVPVNRRSGRIIKHGDEAFALVDTRRAPGSRTKRMQVTYSSDRYELYQDKIEGELPIELLEETRAEKDLPIDLQQMTAMMAKNVIDLRLEYDQLTLASDPAAYDPTSTEILAGTSQWSDPDSSPKGDVNRWREAIRLKIGRYPNTLVLSAKVFYSLDLHPDIRDQFKYVNDNSLTIEMLQRYFNVERVGISTCLVNDPVTGDKRDILENEAILAYVNTELAPNLITPSFGYTYNLKGFPIALPSYYGENEETWYFPVKAEHAPFITFNGAGFLGQNIVA